MHPWLPAIRLLRTLAAGGIYPNWNGKHGDRHRFAAFTIEMKRGILDKPVNTKMRFSNCKFDEKSKKTQQKIIVFEHFIFQLHCCWQWSHPRSPALSIDYVLPVVVPLIRILFFLFKRMHFYLSHLFYELRAVFLLLNAISNTQ
jgi:hypothetical protein